MADRRAVSRRPKKGPPHGVWAHGLQLSPYPHMGPLWATHIARPQRARPHEEARINPAHLSQIARPRCAPTRRAHIARPQCALTLRAHMGDMGSTHPVWVHWFPYGAPHGGSGRKRSPRGERSHYSLKGPREFLFRTKRRSNESPTISTSPSRFSSSSILPRFCARKRRVEPPAALSGEPRDSGGPTTSPSPHIPIAYKYLESTNLSKAPRDKHTRHSPRR